MLGGFRSHFLLRILNLEDRCLFLNASDPQRIICRPVVAESGFVWHGSSQKKAQNVA